MATKLNPLLCELHAHTTWSDGALSVRELVDLHGHAGFDVLAVTDHTAHAGNVDETDFPDYLNELELEAARAQSLYGMLVIPGLELTHEEDDPSRSGHVVAVGLHAFVGVAAGLEAALRKARAHGAALIAAHPYLPGEAATSTRRTAAFAADPEHWAPLVDRFELFNRDTLFPWVAEAGLPVVANGDFHIPEHLSTWKTMLPCAKDERAVVEYLRSPRPAYLVNLGAPAEELRQAA
ncbi:MAG TPA: PHP domain-containing protein [Gaiellaceae bacterium]|nr:PHP domain-containing protein [Gaiellaceae bacterium]